MRFRPFFNFTNIRSILTSPIRCNDKIEVRARFAPSPTGYIHLGGLRTAFYNYIFAKQNGGKFILRLEDTDQSRIVPGSAEDIEETLCWAGLRPDESPILGGAFGPYRQSSRLDLYERRIHELLESGKAYRCFCSPERLDLLRKYQARNRDKPHYDGACRNLSPKEVKEKLNEHYGRHVVRFALMPGQTAFDDLIFGKISIDLIEAREGDPVILKSDRYPTYHFANVVDDHEMRISHVLRGSEWISSTPKHVQLYRAFNWEEPNFAHFPLITMLGGSKMSKRNNESNLRYWREAGYRPTALLNFLTNMGGGLPKAKQDAMECWDLKKLVENFDFSEVARHSASIDLDRLKQFNSNDITNTWNEDPDVIVEQFKFLLKQKGLITDLDDVHLKNIVGRFITRVTTLDDLIAPENMFVWKQPKLTWCLKEYSDKGINLRVLIEDIIRIVSNSNIEEKSSLDLKLKEVASEQKVDWPSLMMLIRKLLTNSKTGLPVHEIFQCLGKNRLLCYLNEGLKILLHE